MNRRSIPAVATTRRWTAGTLAATALVVGGVGVHLAQAADNQAAAARTSTTAAGTATTATTTTAKSTSSSNSSFGQVAPVTNANSGSQAKTGAS